MEDDTITIPIKEEQVDVSKHTVIREEVGIHKEEHEDVEKVTEDVSREELILTQAVMYTLKTAIKIVSVS